MPFFAIFAIKKVLFPRDCDGIQDGIFRREGFENHLIRIFFDQKISPLGNGHHRERRGEFLLFAVAVRQGGIESFTGHKFLVTVDVSGTHKVETLPGICRKSFEKSNQFRSSSAGIKKRVVRDKHAELCVAEFRTFADFFCFSNPINFLFLYTSPQKERPSYSFQ